MKVKIFDSKFIPGLGTGPFDEITITEDQYNLYKRMGISIVNLSGSQPIVETGLAGVTKKRHVTAKKASKVKVIESTEDLSDKTFETQTTIDTVITEETTADEVIEDTSVTETVTTVTTDETVDTEEATVTEDETTSSEETETTSSTTDYDSLTKKQILALLEEAGVEGASLNLTKAELIELAEQYL